MTGAYAASFLPTMLVPFVGLVMPIIVLGLLFLHIESDAN
ncbi:MAG: photosystem I reaction center subunit VIII [Moorea sp. SIO2I5]|nr:photosystem I reaction center subunit VIII [Moorena sp. SIO2I5]